MEGTKTTMLEAMKALESLVLGGDERAVQGKQRNEIYWHSLLD
jgi:hypothetical protein